MLSIPPLVLGGPCADDLGPNHYRVRRGDKLTVFLTVVRRGIGHSER